MSQSGRRTLVVGAWKAYLNHDDALALAQAVALHVGTRDLGFDLALCPSFISIVGVKQALRDTSVSVGAQNVFWSAENGAYTSQITAEQLRNLGCPLVIIGHSELRELGERDGDVNRRARTAIGNEIAPIICVGESAEERRAGDSETKVAHQVKAALAEIPSSDLGSVILAYEPIWAIRSANNPDPSPASTELANEMHASIRSALRGDHGSVADSIRILYGGSVGPENAAEFVKAPDIDGLLIGGKSVQTGPLLEIIDSVATAVGTGTGPSAH